MYFHLVVVFCLPPPFVTINASKPWESVKSFLWERNYKKRISLGTSSEGLLDSVSGTTRYWLFQMSFCKWNAIHVYAACVWSLLSWVCLCMCVCACVCVCVCFFCCACPPENIPRISFRYLASLSLTSLSLTAAITLMFTQQDFSPDFPLANSFWSSQTKASNQTHIGARSRERRSLCLNFLRDAAIRHIRPRDI